MMKKAIFIISIVGLIIHTNVFCKPTIQFMRANRDTVGLYEKFEVQISMLAKYQNPFDPKEIDITATFTSPTGKEWKINGFYNSGTSGGLWEVRFSPNELGKWVYEIKVRDMEENITSPSKKIIVIPSKNHGPIRISANNRYLEYEDGTPYYGVGLWYNDEYSKYNKGRIQPDELDKLKSLGVNFISSYMTPLETMGTGPGRYDQSLSGRLDEVLEMCEERNMNLSLNIWFHSFLSETTWSGGNIRWQVNPYQLVCRAKDFFRSKEAWAHQENLYRYIISRWGHSRALALWFVVDEVNGTDGWASGDSLGAAKWAGKVHNYFKINDPYRHLTTGTRSGSIVQFWHEGYQIFDIAAREIYESQKFTIISDGKIDADDKNPLVLSYWNYANEIKRLWDGYNKPAIIGETGWDHTFYETSMPGYLAQYHNALWICLSKGTAMTPFWWAYSTFLNDNVVTHQLLSFSRFVSTIPLSKLTGLNPTEVNLSNGDAFAMKSDQLVFGWLVNPNADVTGETVTVKSLANGKYTLKIYHTWRGQFIQEGLVLCENGSVTFKLPVLKIEEQHAKYLGQDVAFILIPVK